jgi:hypothetical protein
MWIGLTIAGDLCQLHIRNGLVELVNALFSFSFMKSVVQVQMQEDNSMDRSKILGVELSLRTVEFKGITNINKTLKELNAKGIFEFYVSHIRCNLGEVRILGKRSQCSRGNLGHLWRLAEIT